MKSQSGCQRKIKPKLEEYGESQGKEKRQMRVKRNATVPRRGATLFQER